jgi:hypothetical protein
MRNGRSSSTGETESEGEHSRQARFGGYMFFWQRAAELNHYVSEDEKKG